MTEKLRALLLAFRLKIRVETDHAVAACNEFLVKAAVRIGQLFDLLTNPRWIGLLTLALTIVIVWLSLQSNKLAASSAKDAAASALLAAESTRDTDTSLRLEVAPAFSVSCNPGWTSGAQWDIKLYNDAGGEWSTVGPFGEYKPTYTVNWVSCEFYNYGRLPALQITGALHFNFVTLTAEVQTDRDERIRQFTLRGIGAQGEGIIRFCNPSKYLVRGYIQQGLSFIQPPLNSRGYVQMQTDLSAMVTVPSLVNMGVRSLGSLPAGSFIPGACDTK